MFYFKLMDLLENKVIFDSIEKDWEFESRELAQQQGNNYLKSNGYDPNMCRVRAYSL